MLVSHAMSHVLHSTANCSTGGSNKYGAQRVVAFASVERDIKADSELALWPTISCRTAQLALLDYKFKIVSVVLKQLEPACLIFSVITI